MPLRDYTSVKGPTIFRSISSALLQICRIFKCRDEGEREKTKKKEESCASSFLSGHDELPYHLSMVRSATGDRA